MGGVFIINFYHLYWYNPLIPVLEGQRQVDHYEFKANLTYIVSSKLRPHTGTISQNTYIQIINDI